MWRGQSQGPGDIREERDDEMGVKDNRLPRVVRQQLLYRSYPCNHEAWGPIIIYCPSLLEE